MGEIADSMINGEVCSGCGTLLGGASGFPRWCQGCKPPRKQAPSQKRKLNKHIGCEFCDRKFANERALDEHKVTKHGSKPFTKVIKRRLAMGTIKKGPQSGS